MNNNDKETRTKALKAKIMNACSGERIDVILQAIVDTECEIQERSRESILEFNPEEASQE